MKSSQQILEEIAALKPANLYAQCGDETLIEYLAELCGLDFGPAEFLDLGSGDGQSLSNTYWLRKEKGWSGTCIEGDSTKAKHQATHNLFLTAENIIRSITLTHGGHPINFLSIDLDGNDYWILEKVLTRFKPDFISLEVNQNHAGSKVMPYDASHTWQNDDYYGMTFEAACKLSHRNGYIPIAILQDQNLYLVHASHLPQFDPNFKPAFQTRRVHPPSKRKMIELE